MPQPMTPAPEPNLDALVDALRQARNAAGNGASMLAGMVAPLPYTPGAELVAALRSLVPGRGTFGHELARYNQAAAPEDSVIDTGPLPGEDLWTYLGRQTRSPRASREVMAAATMAGPLVVHASPTWWTGKPHEDFIGTGEGGAAYGRGALYASVPENAQGLDRRYRDAPIEGTFINLAVEDPQIVFDEMRRRMKVKGDLDSFNVLEGVEVDDINDVLDIASNAGIDISDMVERPTGSFHVFDVPDELLDYDAPLVLQPEVLDKIHASVKPVYRPDPGWGAYQYGDNVSLDGHIDADFMSEPARGKDLLELAGIQAHRLGLKGAGDILAPDIPGHTYKGEAGSAATSGIEGAVPNFVIYKGDSVRPLGTFRSAEEWLASELYKQLKPRLDAEAALRASGKATPEGYADIRRRFPIPAEQAEYIQGR